MLLSQITWVWILFPLLCYCVTFAPVQYLSVALAYSSVSGNDINFFLGFLQDDHELIHRKYSE